MPRLSWSLLLAPALLGAQAAPFPVGSVTLPFDPLGAAAAQRAERRLKGLPGAVVEVEGALPWEAQAARQADFRAYLAARVQEGYRLPPPKLQALELRDFMTEDPGRPKTFKIPHQWDAMRPVGMPKAP